ncbi:MAG: DoxX family protein [bacterium]|nr:DoxX family protein [bacterium]MDZ4231648.1 DoxX family protein [Candidatus Pacearchaeota archaeon]
MNRLYLRTILFLSRISIGWLFLYAGLDKIFNPSWTSKGYLLGAKTLPGVYAFFASPGILPFVDFLNEWGLTLLGISLILGVLVRFSSWFAVLLMFLYYLPVLQFPYVGEHSFLVDEHIIYIFFLLMLGALNAGRSWGLDSLLRKKGKKG